MEQGTGRLAVLSCRLWYGDGSNPLPSSADRNIRAVSDAGAARTVSVVLRAVNYAAYFIVRTK
jgi:hypothetical protein